MKLHDGMLVKRKDSGAKGVVQKLKGNMVKVKYHDGTFSYTSMESIKDIFVVPELNIDVRVGSKDDGVEPPIKSPHTNLKIVPLCFIYLFLLIDYILSS